MSIDTPIRENARRLAYRKGTNKASFDHAMHVMIAAFHFANAGGLRAEKGLKPDDKKRTAFRKMNHVRMEWLDSSTDIDRISVAVDALNGMSAYVTSHAKDVAAFWFDEMGPASQVLGEACMRLHIGRLLYELSDTASTTLRLIDARYSHHHDSFVDKQLIARQEALHGLLKSRVEKAHELCKQSINEATATFCDEGVRMANRITKRTRNRT